MTKDIFIKYLEGNCSEEEFRQIIDWFKDCSLTNSSREMVEEVWDECEHDEVPNEKLMFNYILNRVYQKIDIAQEPQQQSATTTFAFSRLRPWILKAAAVLLLPILSVVLYESVVNQGFYSEGLKDLEVVAPASSRIKIELSDGTKVWLNQGSKLKYPYRFGRKSRQVFLDGEAYFEVAHNKDVPFLVETKPIEVKATGTSFNVSAYPGDSFAETTLDEGKVILYSGETHREIRALSPKESLRFNLKANTYSVESGNTEKHTGWKDGRLVFRNDSLAVVARKLEHWFNVDIEIINKEVAQFTYTATFANETLPQVLDLLTLPTPVSYELAPVMKNADGSFSRQKVLISLKTTNKH